MSQGPEAMTWVGQAAASAPSASLDPGANNASSSPAISLAWLCADLLLVVVNGTAGEVGLAVSANGEEIGCTTASARFPTAGEEESESGLIVASIEEPSSSRDLEVTLRFGEEEEPLGP